MMGYRDSHGRDGWHTDTNSIDSMGLEMLPAQAPQHPIPTMQGAFEESMMETLQDSDTVSKEYAKADALTRRRMLLEAPEYERTVAGKWKQKANENFHPLWKLVAQISFGMHLLHQGLAKSDDEVIKILQTHVDEIDGFLERTTEDLELAQRDINERIRYLKLPLEHGDVFDNMLMDRKFRNAILDGNEKIEHIVDRTSVTLRDTLKDVKKGFDGTRELARYFRKLDKTWENQTEEHMGVYAAMMGNTEGWTSAYVDLQNKGNVLHDSLTELSTIIAEIQRRVGIASRKNIPPSTSSSRANTQPPSRVASIYSPSTPQSPTQKPHISNAIGTGMRRHGSTNPSISERMNSEKKPHTGDRYRSPPTGAAASSSTSRGHSRRGSDESGSRRVSFSEGTPNAAAEPVLRNSGNWTKRQSKDKSQSVEGFKTSWFRKSSSDTNSLKDKDKDKRKSASASSLRGENATSQESDGILRSSSLRNTKTVTPKESPQPSQAVISQPPPRVSESIGSQARRPVRDSVTENVLEEVTEEEEAASEEEEPEVEIAHAAQVESTTKDTLPKEVTVASSTNSPVTAQKPVLRDLPLRDYKHTEPVPDSPPRLDLDNGPSLAEAVAALKRSSTFHGTERSSVADASTRTSDLRPEPLKVHRVSSFEPLDKKRISSASVATSAMSRTPAKRPSNLKLFPTISVSPGPSTAPLASTRPLYSPEPVSTPKAEEKVDPDTKSTNADEDEELPKQPRTPAERGRSPPPPERVPTPLLEQQRMVSPTLRALTSATVSGPEPDFPYGFGEVDLGGEGHPEHDIEPVVAELGDGRRTTSGSRASTPEHAELGADSPAARHTPKTVQSPFIDPEEQKEEAEARRRDRELRDEAAKKKVQEQIVSRVVQKASMDLTNRDVRYPTGETARLKEPPQVSPAVTEGQYQQPKHSPLSVPLEQASPQIPNYNNNSNLPFSKHNRSRDLKSLLKRFFRIGQNKDRKASYVSHVSTATGEFERPPRERRGFSLALPFGLSSRRKRSYDPRLNMQGGLQPFGVWRNTPNGMSWGDTRRGSVSNTSPFKNDPGTETETDDSNEMSDRSEAARSPKVNPVPGAIPRPQQGTMEIPGVGSIDWSRASAYMKYQNQREMEVQNLLARHGDSSEENQAAIPPVPQVPAQHVANKAEPESEEDEEDGQEEDEKDEGVEDEDEKHAHRTATGHSEKEDGSEEPESSEHENASDEAHDDAHPAEFKHATLAPPHQAAESAKSEETSRHPSPKPADSEVAEHEQRRSTQSHHSHHSEAQSEQSETTGRASSLATSSVLARKSDATPTTGLSLQFASPLTSEIFVGGQNQHADDPKAAAAAAAAAHPATAEAKDGPAAAAAAATGLTTIDASRSGLGRNLSASASAAAAANAAARSPALGADKLADPLDRAGSAQQASPLAARHDSVKGHERESLGVGSNGEGSPSPSPKETSPAGTKPLRSSSLGQAMTHEESSEDEEAGEHKEEDYAKEDEAEDSDEEAAAHAEPEEHGRASKASERSKASGPHAEHEAKPDAPHVAAAAAEPDEAAEAGAGVATETKPVVPHVGGDDGVVPKVAEPAIRVEEVMRERAHGNGTPF